MRNIFETAKKAQMAPVRGRVKAMMAQPRAIPQARKIARQTTGFARGGVPEDKKKRKPGPQPGLRRPKLGPTPAQPRPKARPPAERPKAPEGGRRPSERPKAPKAGPPAGRPQAPRAGPPAGRPQAPKKKKEGMYVKKGGVVQKAFLGKLMSKLGIGKERTGSRQEALAGQDYKRMRPEPTHEQTVDVVKKHMGYQKGGVMEKPEKYPHVVSYLANVLKDKDRLTEQDIKRAEKLTESFGKTKDKNKLSVQDIIRTKTLTKAQIDRLLKQANRPDKQKQAQPYLEAGRAKGKEHKENLRKLLRKGEGYVKGWIGKKKGGAAKKKTFLERRRQLSLGIGSRDKSPFLERRRKLSIGIGKKKGGTGWKKAHGGLIKGKPKLATRGW